MILKISPDALLATAVADALRLLDAGPDNPDGWSSVLGRLPAGGVECEEQCIRVIAILRKGLDQWDNID